ncbi:unnamed protein product [Spirodela intermedia]|uniref:GIR1-like zinc ribbon domain-containing protein n=1 Tax=Spirodela intermedia TaxID=51605 RepID=A0A7I8L7T5_SPIIN|nr:unnamed protein product [Spirodela intermedia]
MSRNGKSPKIDQRPSLWSPRGSSSAVGGGSSAGRNNDGGGGGNNGRNRNLSNSPHRSSTSSSSPPSSCVSSESEDGKPGSSPEAAAMVLAGCPHCLMYVMLSEDDPKCPRCKSTVLLDFLKNNPNSSTSRKTRKN